MGEHKVIIIGGDHFNTLGLVRSFGVNGIKPYGIIVDPRRLGRRQMAAATSRYWAGVWIVGSEDEALVMLLDEFSDEGSLPVIVPASDGAAYMLDTHYDQLSGMFILPSMGGRQGAIANLMNKYNQAKWAESLGIKVAETFMVRFDDSIPYERFPYPCIVKPVLSHEGSKRDIRKLDDLQALRTYIEHLSEMGYKRILLQRFLEKDYEMELFGAVLKNSETVPYILTKHEREWPVVGGSVCFHRFIKEERYINMAKDILRKVKESGYVGNFDIELLNVGGEIYLNEINFRNSGDIYACFHSKMFYSLYSYLDMIGEMPQKMNVSYGDSHFAMCENRDIMHVRRGRISLWQWLRCLAKTRDFAYFSARDIRPALVQYGHMFDGVLRKCGKRKKRT